MSGASGKITGQGAGDRIREPVPVEALLQWAYGEQMVHLAQRETLITTKGGGMLSKFSGSAMWSDEAVPIDTSANLGFRASDDAWIVRKLVDALKPVEVDLGQDLAASRFFARGEFRGAPPPVTRASTADHTGTGWPTNGILRINVRSLVEVHANRATRPDMPGPARWRLKAVHKGMVRHPRSKGGIYQLGWYHHLEIGGVKAGEEGVTPGEVAEASAIYAAWWEALDELRRQLKQMRLTMFMLTDAMPRKIQAPS